MNIHFFFCVNASAIVPCVVHSSGFTMFRLGISNETGVNCLEDGDDEQKQNDRVCNASAATSIWTEVKSRKKYENHFTFRIQPNRNNVSLISFQFMLDARTETWTFCLLMSLAKLSQFIHWQKIFESRLSKSTIDLGLHMSNTQCVRIIMNWIERNEIETKRNNWIVKETLPMQQWKFVAQPFHLQFFAAKRWYCVHTVLPFYCLWTALGCHSVLCVEINSLIMTSLCTGTTITANAFMNNELARVRENANTETVDS